MSVIAKFRSLAGKKIFIPETHTYGYVPTDDELEDFSIDLVESFHPMEEIEDGYQLVAAIGPVEDGKLADRGGFIAVNEDEDKMYICNVDPEWLETPASKVTIETP